MGKHKMEDHAHARRDKRTNRVPLRLTVDERERLNAAADRDGLPTAVWVRWLVLRELERRDTNGRSATSQPLR